MQHWKSARITLRRYLKRMKNKIVRGFTFAMLFIASYSAIAFYIVPSVIAFIGMAVPMTWCLLFLWVNREMFKG